MRLTAIVDPIPICDTTQSSSGPRKQHRIFATSSIRKPMNSTTANIKKTPGKAVSRVCYNSVLRKQPIQQVHRTFANRRIRGKLRCPNNSSFNIANPSWPTRHPESTPPIFLRVGSKSHRKKNGCAAHCAKPFNYVSRPTTWSSATMKSLDLEASKTLSHILIRECSVQVSRLKPISLRPHPIYHGCLPN